MKQKDETETKQCFVTRCFYKYINDQYITEWSKCDMYFQSVIIQQIGQCNKHNKDMILIRICWRFKLVLIVFIFRWNLKWNWHLLETQPKWWQLYCINICTYPEKSANVSDLIFLSTMYYISYFVLDNNEINIYTDTTVWYIWSYVFNLLCMNWLDRYYQY